MQYVRYLIAAGVLLAAPGAVAQFHSADTNGDYIIGETELLRVIQFFHTGGYGCGVSTVDGYAPGAGATDCTPHASDFQGPDWRIDLGETLRLVQLARDTGYHRDGTTEDGFAPGLPDLEALPSAAFSLSASAGPAPLEVACVDLSEPGTSAIHTWLWDFGDGGQSGLQDPTHVYAEPGSYTITLTVTNDAGFSTATEGPIAVYAAAPEFSKAGGTFTSPFQLTLSGGAPEAVIRYTTDGTAPAATSPIYTGPVPVSGTMAVSARFFYPTAPEGPVATETYLQVDASLADFNSNLPLVLVDSLNHDFADDNSVTGDYPYEKVYSTFIEVGETGRASILDAADHAGLAGMHVRGASSATFPKKQYKLETRDAHGEDLSVPLLGMPDEADWILYGPYFDKTFMRNHLVYRWWEDLGYYSPRTRFAEMFLHHGAGPVSMDDYVGVYVVVENIKRDGDRVDVQRVDPADTVEPGITGGYILQTTNINQHFVTSTGVYMKYEYPKETDPVPQHLAWIRSYINAFEAALTGWQFADPEAGYRAYVDVPSHVDYDIMRELTRNIDGASTFFSKDRGGKITMGPLWDYNQSLGMTALFDDEHGWETDGWNDNYMRYNHWASWWDRMDDDPEYQLQWADRWWELRKGPLSNAALLQRLDDTNALLAEAAARNYARWPVLGQSVWETPDPREAPGFEERDTWQKEVDWMRDWLVARLAWLDSQVTPAPVYSQDGGAITPGFQLGITNPLGTGTVYYTLDGSDPRGAAARQYSEPITLTETTRVKARVHRVQGWSPLADAVFAVTTVADALRIVEMMYHPADAPEGNPDAEFIELRNIGLSPINPRFARFTDGIGYVFPDVEMAPGASVVIVQDTAAFSAFYGAGVPVLGEYEGRQSNGGEQVVLQDASGGTIQAFTYDDAWHPSTDGGGYSLTVVDPAQDLALWSDPAGWHASTVQGGTPGLAEN